MKVFGIKCNVCKDIIYSRTRHDFRYCTCESCAIDGGQNASSFRIIGQPSNWELVKDIDINAQSLTDLYEDWNTNTNQFGLIKCKV